MVGTLQGSVQNRIHLAAWPAWVLVLCVCTHAQMAEGNREVRRPLPISSKPRYWKPVVSVRLVSNPRWITDSKDSSRQMQHNCKVCAVLHACVLNLTGKYLYSLASCKRRTNILSEHICPCHISNKQKRRSHTQTTPVVAPAPVHASQLCSLCSCASAVALHQENPAVVSCGRRIGCKNLVVHVHKTTRPTLPLPRCASVAN